MYVLHQNILTKWGLKVSNFFKKENVFGISPRSIYLKNLGFALLRTISDDDTIILCGHNNFVVIN